LTITTHYYYYYYYYYYYHYHHHHHYHHHLLHPHHRSECRNKNCVHCSTICRFLSSVAVSTSVRWEEVRFVLPFHPCPVTIQLWSKKAVSWFRRLVASFLGPPSQASSCGIFGRQSGTETASYSKYFGCHQWSITIY